MAVKTDRRNSALDIVRLFALFCVISVHFFYNNGFYSTPIAGWRMYTMVIIRNFFMISVPLFLILSGYLMGAKRPNKAYFLGLGKTLLTYILAAIVCIFYRIWKKNASYSFLTAIIAITDFTGAQYAWYVEMYIGLYLLIPFLNILYDGLENKKQKRTLLLVFVFLTSVPSVVNIFRLGDPGWFAAPIRSSAYHFLLPDWWTDSYPITYYFLGRYLREFPLKQPRHRKLLSIAALTLATGAFNIYRSLGVNFVWGVWQGWYGLPNLLLAVLVFDFLAHVDCSGLKPVLRKLLKTGSDLVLGAYLVSWIFDQIAYPRLAAAVPDMPMRLPCFLAVVPWVFVCSLALSGAIELIAWPIRKGFHCANDYLKVR